MSKDRENDFFDYAYNLLGEQVQVITVEGSYYGELKELEKDFLLLLTNNRGQSSIIAIRFKKIIGISRTLYKERRRPLFFGQQRGYEQEHHEHEHHEEQHDSSDHSSFDDHDFHDKE